MPFKTHERPCRRSAVHRPWERQRRDASSKSATASVGAGSPSHIGGASPVGAATPRRQRQVRDSLSRGRKPLPQMPFKTHERPCRRSAVHRPWERQRRDASSKSATASGEAGTPSPKCRSTRTSAPAGGRPCIARGSGNAATPAASPRQPQARQETPRPECRSKRTSAPVRRSAVHRPWERQRRDASGKSATASGEAGNPSPECRSTRTSAPVGAARAPRCAPRHLRPHRGRPGANADD